VLCIIAFHKNLETTNGLHPNALVSELLQKYPKMMIEMDVMNMWNFFEDEKNEWRFVFEQLQEPDEGNQADLETPMKPKDYLCNQMDSDLLSRIIPLIFC
jgi:hypothetical protein